jgi:NAD-dependent deacetylase
MQPIDDSELVHLHGEIFVTRCSRCNFAMEDPTDTPPNSVPRCPKCDSFLRPGVVWFGEGLPDEATECVLRFLAMGNCDAVSGEIGVAFKSGGWHRWKFYGTKPALPLLYLVPIHE